MPGSDDPTKAAFPFLHGDVLSEADHDVQIFLLGEGVSLMRKSVANGGSGGLAAPGRSPHQTAQPRIPAAVPNYLPLAVIFEELKLPMGPYVTAKAFGKACLRKTAD